MPQTITPAGIELNPTTEPIEEPIKSTSKEGTKVNEVPNSLG